MTALEYLRSVEWKHIYRSPLGHAGGIAGCPECAAGPKREYKHFPNCQLASAIADAERMEIAALCPVCVGKPISNKPCICGGKGDAMQAYLNLVREYAGMRSKAEVEASIFHGHAHEAYDNALRWVLGGE